MKVNDSPRITINKLGEYIYATPARKQKILNEAKFPSEFIVTRYVPAQNAAIQYFKEENRDIQIFDNVKKIVSKKAALNDYQKEKIKSCIEALNNLRECVIDKLVPYNDFAATKGFKECSAIVINGVMVSLRPEILLLDRETNQPKGAIKLAFSKNHFLTIQEGQCISGLIREHLEKELNVKCEYDKCITLDVFSKRLIKAPVRNEWTMEKIENACIDIKTIWPTLSKKTA